MAVFEWTCDYPVDYDLGLEEIRLRLGAGVYKIVEKSLAKSRQDGTGSVTSYNGENIFGFSCTKRRAIDADDVWDFLRTRLTDKAQFDFYDPAVTAPPDSTGVTVAGKHKVKLLSVKRTLVQLDEFRFDVVVVEDLS